MIYAVTWGNSLEEVREQLKDLPPYVEGIEFRLDQMPFLSKQSISVLSSLTSLPRMFTDHKGDHLSSLLTSDLPTATYVDLNWKESNKAEQMRKSSLFLLLSYHNFDKPPSPSQLEEIVGQMQQGGAACGKIACTVDSFEKLSTFSSLAHRSYPLALSWIPMGNRFSQLRALFFFLIPRSIYYLSTRPCAPSFAPGLPTIKEQHSLFVQLHRLKKMRKAPSLYALIGNPIDQSPGDRLYNRFFSLCGKQALYLKIPLSSDELPLFFQWIRSLPFRGLSITAPLKQSILPYLDEMSQEARAMGAVNLIGITAGKIRGENSDGQGALQMIREHYSSLRGKRIFLLGAGGSARALAYSLLQEGAHLFLFNRTFHRARELVREIGGKAYPLCSLPSLASREGYDLFIQTTSAHTLSFSPSFLLPGRGFMDIRWGAEKSSLYREAVNKKCTIFPAKRLFFFQALEQLRLWFPSLCAEEKRIWLSLYEIP